MTLARGSNSAKIDFLPGQYAALGYYRPNGQPTRLRTFSITSSPDNVFLEFAIRIIGDFTHGLAQLHVGDGIFLQGPFGNFVIDPSIDRPAVMIAGGIGITPFMSILRTPAVMNTDIQLTLLYGCRTIADAPFYEELVQLTKHYPNLHLSVFVADSSEMSADPSIIQGMLSAQHIKQIVAHNADATFLLCGPDAMMAMSYDTLYAENISADSIVSESFSHSSKLTIGSGYNLQKLTYALSGALLILAVTGVSYLDLSRYISSNAAAAPTSLTNTNQPAPSNNYSQASNDESLQQQPARTYQQSYQQPVTSVS